MGIRTFIQDTLDTWRGPIKRQDAPLWANTRSLEDVAELTAQWLEGRIDSQPGYFGRVDVDTAEGLREALIDLNRVGFLTNNSQDGYDDAGYDGAHWTALASVTGFAKTDVAERLAAAMDGTDFEVLAHDNKEHTWGRGERGVAVTCREGQPFTEFGAQLSWNAIAGSLYDGCSDAAMVDIFNAKQVTVYDPVPGRNTLWPALHDFAVRERAAMDDDTAEA